MLLISIITTLYVPALALAQSAGCGTEPNFSPGNFNNQLTSNGREYRIWLPDSYDFNTQAPLILSYHGGGQNISRQTEVDRFSQPVINSDHIVVYLQGLPNPEDGGTAWEGVPGITTDDKGFTTDVVDYMEENFCINTDRIYATGFSMGGGLTNLLACDPTLSVRISAFAPVSGAYYVETETCNPETVEIPCSPARPKVPIRAFHGGSDGVIAYEGGVRRGGCLPAIEHWAASWATRNGLSATPDEDSILEGVGNAQNITFGEGLVKLVYVGDGGTHSWPGSDQGTVDMDASVWIMDFFRRF